MELGDDDIEIIVPEIADLEDELDGALVTLTEAISKVDPEIVAHGFLGGHFGYGADYENDVFMMHHYCWCESENCRWCSEDACGCPHPDPKCFVDGVEVSSDRAWEFSESLLGKMPHEVAEYGTLKYIEYSKVWDARVAERNARSKTIYQARSHTCKPHGMMANRMEGESWKPNQCAPNFWHKPSGLKVWWYKWIGRDMETHGIEGLNLSDIFNECLASLPKAAP